MVIIIITVIIIIVLIILIILIIFIIIIIIIIGNSTVIRPLRDLIHQTDRTCDSLPHDVHGVLEYAHVQRC